MAGRPIRPLPQWLIIDDSDREVVARHNWSIDHEGYPHGPKNLRLHRFLIPNVPRNMVVDHINGNKLDNRRANLRIIPHHANLHNCGPSRKSRTGVRGVYWNRTKKRFEARINVGGEKYRLGRYRTLEEAAAVRRAAEMALLPEIVQYDGN
jgi:hypothetical protein